MSKNSENLSRGAFFEELVHYFDAYHVLTEQARVAIEAENVELLNRFFGLRQETIARIDAFEEQHSRYMQVPIEEEGDPQVLAHRRKLRDIITRIRNFEEGMEARMISLRDTRKTRAGDIAKGQRGIQAYIMKTKKDATFVEDTK